MIEHINDYMRAFESLFNGHKSEILLKKNNYVCKHFIVRQYNTFNLKTI